MAKAALITFGNEESYGLSFVGGELLENGQEIKFFDGEVADGFEVAQWEPDYLMLSPLSLFYRKALGFAHIAKKLIPKVKTVFGGHHILSGDFDDEEVDIAVRGPVRGTIPRILRGEKFIQAEPTDPSDLPKPARAEYYRDIPRAAKRYRKFVLAMMGCPWNCSYCSSSSGHIRATFGGVAYKSYYMQHRPVEDVIAEIEEVMKYDTHEIEWVDDDIFSGDENWLLEFLRQYRGKFDVPMYVSATSATTLSVSDELLKRLSKCCNVVGLGVQAVRPESLKLFNRQWDSIGKMQAAYNRLISFGFRVNLQCIVGLPIDDPVEDAIETVLGMQKIGRGSVCSCYPLMIYPGTAMEQYCRQNKIKLNENCDGDTNGAVCNIAFDKATQRRLRNICKLATLFVRYDIDEKWMRALVDIDFDGEASEKLSMARYRECVVDRLKSKGDRIFDDILNSMKLQF